ncbi:HNH endonuclease [Candidatus Pacearchaeota archaeon]|nr:HNH endonuclease [Candidatus Pacearchaeota archaeon]
MKKIDISTKTYPNKFALVDDEDYDWLMQWKWHAAKSNKAHNTFYAVWESKDGAVSMHRRILGKAVKGLKSDHRDRNGLNNQRYNLRICTHAENMRNRRIQCNNKSGYKGVSWNRREKKWLAQIKFNGKTIYLGRYFCLIKAAEAYDAAAEKYYGEFARLNFPQ